MKKARSIRVSDALWFKVKLKARQEDKTVSQIVVDFLREYVKAQIAKKNPYTGKVAVQGFFLSLGVKLILDPACV